MTTAIWEPDIVVYLYRMRYVLKPYMGLVVTYLTSTPALSKEHLGGYNGARTATLDG